MRTTLAIICLAGVAAAAPQSGGAIRGRVEVLQSAPAVERRPTVTDLGGPPARGTVDSRRTVVYLESAPRGAFDDRLEHGRATMDQRAETFVPHVLAIMAGTTVEFPNNDRTYHNVFSLSKPKTFDLGRYATGKSKSVRFDRAGIVRVFCDIHSHMNAFVLVFGHRFFAVTDDEDRFELRDVPPGSYTLSAWFEGAVRDQRAITVTGETRVVDLEFTVR
jgi:plastocyanin